MSVAELGYIVDGKAGRLELIATIYQLKTRKYVTLSQHDDGQLLISLISYTPENLSPHEDLLMRVLFHKTQKIYLQDLFSQYDFVILVGYFNYLTLQSLVRKNLLKSEGSLYELPYGDFLARVGEDPLRLIRELIRSIRKRKLTPQGEKLIPIIKGFKFYIETAEIDKIKFHIKSNLQDYIEIMTPYAIIFKQTERWETIKTPLFTHITDANPNPQVYQSGTDSYREMREIVERIDNYTINQST